MSVVSTSLVNVHTVNYLAYGFSNVIFLQGSNWVWHVDGHDKLKPYGFCIHGGIDGFSRKLLWLHVDQTNNDPWYIAKYYMDYVKRNHGTVNSFYMYSLDTYFVL